MSGRIKRAVYTFGVCDSVVVSLLGTPPWGWSAKQDSAIRSAHWLYNCGWKISLQGRGLATLKCVPRLMKLKLIKLHTLWYETASLRFSVWDCFSYNFDWIIWVKAVFTRGDLEAFHFNNVIFLKNFPRFIFNGLNVWCDFWLVEGSPCSTGRVLGFELHRAEMIAVFYAQLFRISEWYL